VVRVFDVVRPLSNPNTDDLLVLPQPFVQSKKEEESSSLNTFVGSTNNGGWYALSEANFPYVTRHASDAKCYKNALEWKNLSLNERGKYLVGVHRVQDPGPDVYRRSLPAPSKLNGDSTIASDNTDYVQPMPEHSLQRISTRWKQAKGAWAFVFSALIICFTASVVYTPPSIRKSFKRVAGLSLGYFATLPSAPVIQKIQNEETKPSKPITVEILEYPPEGPKPKGEKEVSNSDESKLSESGSLKLTAVRFQEPEPSPSKEVMSKLSAAGVENKEESASESAVVTTPKKKKYPRGRRGGRNKKSNDNNSTPEKSVPVAGLKPPNITVVSSGKVEEISPGSPFILNSLEVLEDEVIGRFFSLPKYFVFLTFCVGAGSQGTTVHKGSWEGKVVAVKRILTTYADVAMKEVQTLQDADYHENVVRYYCQQQRGSFLYIALELCPGSLYDVVTRPHSFEELVICMDPRDTLNQITRGLHHLHTLKIVHRDIKPQNILVGAPNFRSNRPRLLISDFGLCKKLHSDEYSFGATTAQHAGTVGWRAPELLQDAVSVYAQPSENSGSGTGTSTDIVVDPLTKRRATRANDVFSLGCIFYFVLSRGQHPFDE
jgi:serine/threonine-protein kinase/endoribonuclease IRE1